MFERIGGGLSGLNDYLSLKWHGYYDEPKYGLTPYPDKPLFESIRRFQKDNDLTVDGVMKPGGETETTLNRTCLAQAAPLEERARDENILRQFIQTRNEQRKKTTAPDSAPPIPKRKPEILAPTAKGNALLDLIGELESSDNYNVIYGGEHKPLTTMTVKEIYDLQKRMIKEGKGSSVVGRYQFKHSTLKETIDKLGINESALFDEKLQDRLARSRLQYRKFEDYKAGKITADQLIEKLASEWAALPKDSSNKSRHDGVLNNKALIDFKTLKDLLEQN